MSDYRSAIEREMGRVDPRPYSSDVFHERRIRAARRRRTRASALGLLVGAMVVASMVVALRGREGGTPATPPITPTNVSNLHRYWSNDTGASIDSWPVVDGDRVYVTNTRGTLLAFPTTCSSAPAPCDPIWTADEGAHSTFDIGSPAVGDGKVFVGTVQGVLYGYPTSCGPGDCQPVWEALPGSKLGRPAGDLSTAAPVVADGRVYVGSRNGRLYAYATSCDSYPRPCLPLWTSARLHGGFGEDGYAGAQPVVSDGVVYVGSTGGTLYSFPASCTLECSSFSLRSVPLAAVINNPLVLVDGTLYVTSGRHLYAFPTRCLERGASCGPDWIGQAKSLILSAPVVGDGYVYVGTTDGSVAVFPEACGQHGQTCRPAWSITDLGHLPNPSLVDGVLFVGSSWAVNELQAYDATCGASGGTCSPLWTYRVTDLGAFVQQTASEGGNTLFAATGALTGGGEGGPGGTLYAFRVGPRRAAGQVASREPGASPPDLVMVSVLGLAVALSVAWWRRRARRLPQPSS